MCPPPEMFFLTCAALFRWQELWDIRRKTGNLQPGHPLHRPDCPSGNPWNGQIYSSSFFTTMAKSGQYTIQLPQPVQLSLFFTTGYRNPVELNSSEKVRTFEGHMEMHMPQPLHASLLIWIINEPPDVILKIFIILSCVSVSCGHLHISDSLFYKFFPRGWL